jgi:hypothetical protein
MYRGKVISPAEVDFWLDFDKYVNYFSSTSGNVNDVGIFTIDMVRLSSIRKAVSNFVRILTRSPIPVYFNDVEANFNLGGKVIYISATINSKQDFDVAVGQALHEGAHTVKTNFDVVKNAWANIPSKILKLSDSKNIRRASLEKFIHNIWNVIEDRYIDNYVFNEAPGYRGYYVALYNRFWNNPEVDELLLSDKFRYPSLDSYSFRITNFTNVNTDLLALPRLSDIAYTIDISHIDRLKKTKDRIEKAFEVTEIALDCLDGTPQCFGLSLLGKKVVIKQSKDNLADPRDYFDFDDESDKKSKGEDKKDKEKKNSDSEKEDVDVGKKMVDEISDVLTGKDQEPEKLKENSDVVNRISEEDNIEREVKKKIKDVVESQRQFLAGEIPKTIVTEQQKSLLDLVEKHGIVIVQVDVPNILSGDDKNLKVDCIVVQKMTKELVFSGREVFPLSSVMKIGDQIPKPEKEMVEAVRKGVQLGIKLGRKLQIRAEVHPIKIVRKKWGKINKRQIHEAAFDAEDLFYKIKIDDHHRANLHITVDASSSMTGNKWLRTMTAVVAICKAASMIDNVHITVSFRSTQASGIMALPYIVFAYDSKKDKFSKIRTLFPYLLPNGCTPEGLAFGAIMNLFEGITPDEEDRYFLNLSDGEPYYLLSVPNSGLALSYSGEVGATHTKAQVDKIRRHGVEILSYFIEEDYSWRFQTAAGQNLKKKPEEMTKEELEEEKRLQLEKEQSPLRKNFRRMYGPSAKFIEVNDIVPLAKTMNDLFLSKNRNCS